MKKKKKKKKKDINKLKENKQRKKEWRINYINWYKNNILDHKDDIWTPNLNINYNEEETDSWFHMRTHVSNSNHNVPYINLSPPVVKKKDKLRKCIKLNLKLTKQQKQIFNDWFNAYTIMYNKTLKLIKDIYKESKQTKLSFFDARKILKNERNGIILDSQNKNINYKDTTVKTHILDQAIRLVISNYKSAITNLKRGHIKHFRMRYWKFLRTNKILDIEQVYFRNNSICPNIFGSIRAFYDKKEFILNNINSDCRLRYNGRTREYNLFIPILIEPEGVKNRKEFICLDPGLRTFMTGLSENEVVKIGTNVKEKLSSCLNRLDKNQKVKDKNRKYKKERLYYRKLENIVNDLHWKAINVLTNRYKNILIGDMSAKGIIRNGRSVLSAMDKRVVSSLSFYKFRQRLEYKCKIKRLGYKVVDERYTSKVCSNCGWLHKNLNGNKKFKCGECGIQVDRDVNGCRGIYIKSQSI